MRALASVGGAFLLAASAGCSHHTVNDPLERVDPDSGYRVQATSGDVDDSTELLLVVTFSGGGTRAAALTYGVLEALRDTVVHFDGQDRRLVDEIDIISSVSGGSVTAAYFGLHGDGIFDGFDEAFLYRNVQGALTARLLAPWNWVRLASPHFGRSDIAAEYFDKILFRGATYNDLLDGESPAIVVNATDINIGARFGFEQDQFDLLCSDLGTYPIARAVAASSAVPVLLSPMTLTNYPRSQCGYKVPDWVRDELARSDKSSRRYQEAKRIDSYISGDDTRYVHLLDGGLADNLGLRATIEKAALAGGYVGLVHMTGFQRFRRVAHVVINAQRDTGVGWTDRKRPPGTMKVSIEATGVTLNRYAFETVETFNTDRERWMRDLVEYRCENAATLPLSGACDDLNAHFVEIALTRHPDPAEREYLTSLPTSFHLERDQVDRVRAAARDLLDQSPAFQALLADLRVMGGGGPAPIMENEPAAGLHQRSSTP